MWFKVIVGGLYGLGNRNDGLRSMGLEFWFRGSIVNVCLVKGQCKLLLPLAQSVKF